MRADRFVPLIFLISPIDATFMVSVVLLSNSKPEQLHIRQNMSGMFKMFIARRA